MPAASLVLKNAVQQDRLMSRTGLSQRLFSAWFDGFVYNQIWEDPRVDLQALELREDSRVLTIASGGCNILNYLQASPAAVIAVDLNPYHMSLTRLKLAALRHLPDQRHFFDFFADAAKAENLEHYRRYVQPHLDADSRAFWETDSLWRRLRGKRRIDYFRDNLYRHARSGYFLRFVHGLAGLMRFDTAQLLQAQNQAEQEQIFQTHIAPFFDNWLVKQVVNRSFSVFSLGIPPQQYQAMKAECDGHLVDLFRARVKRLCCGFPIEDNYFAWQSFGLRYDTEHRRALPDYLKAEHYARIKANAERVETHVGSLFDYLARQTDHSLDRFVLLDAQDWMKAPVIAALWQEIARVGKPGSRIIFRTAAQSSPVETALPDALRARFTYHRETSQALHAQDRAAIYGGFHLYTLE